jgi:hypothetical protein
MKESAMKSPSQSRWRVQPLICSLTVGLSLLTLSSESASAAPQSVTYLQQFQILRSPDDVAVTPGAGGIAVVRASEHYPDPIGGPVGNGDEIIVVKTTDGSRATPLTGCTNFGLSIPSGASDLIAINSQRAVLLGQKHFGGSETSYVNVLDLTDVYGAGPKCLFGGSWQKAGAGHVNDVAITPDGRYAVVNHKGWISVFTIDGTSVPAPVEFDTQGADPSYQKNSVVMTQSRNSQSPIKCVVITNHKSGNLDRTWAYVLDLTTSTPMLEATLEINASNPLEDNPPHDVQLTPDDSMAVVSAGGVVALISWIPWEQPQGSWASGARWAPCASTTCWPTPWWSPTPRQSRWPISAARTTGRPTSSTFRRPA